jgi:hypothetical protein
LTIHGSRKYHFPPSFMAKQGQQFSSMDRVKLLQLYVGWGGGGACVEMKEISLRTFLAGSDFEWHNLYILQFEIAVIHII